MFFEKKVIFSILGGFALGKTGNEIFGSETAKKAYLKAATGAMILKDNIMERVEVIQAAASDIAADARAEADKYQEKKDASFETFLKAAMHRGNFSEFDSETEEETEDDSEAD